MFKPTSGLTSKGIRRAAETTASLAPEPTSGATGLTPTGLRRSAEDVTASPPTAKSHRHGSSWPSS